ncbi:MAG: trypsin-like peptidase domain-containing protein, partial [Nitrospirae bacterium]|nr:trypsin-like peptidase domain-containing protein [Nitrospirota bacterium]
MKLLQIAVFLVAVSAASASMAAELTPRQIYERAAPGVVLIIGHPQQGEGGSGGTGSIIRKDGLVLTNAHVVIDEKTGKPYPRLSLYLKPDRVTGNPKTDLSRRVNASVTAFNRQLDLALLKMEAAPASLSVLDLSDPDRVKIGEHVVAIGHPEQGGLWTLTTGVVSAEFEDYGNTKGKHVFQTETGLNRGNSGGPLLDTQGRIVGVNTAIARLAADGLPIMSISFAVKSSVARTWLREQAVMVDYVSAQPERPPVPAQAPIVAAPEKPAVPPAQAPSAAAPKAQPPQVHTEVRPYDLDELIRGARSETERDLDQMMKNMRQKTKP